MQLYSRNVDKLVIVEIGGRFDAHVAPAVRQELEAGAVGDNPQIVVDLDGVNFIDSSGLAALVQGLKRCRARGGNLSLCSLQQPVQIIFELTRLDRAFDIYDSERKAIIAISDSIQ